MTHVLGNDKKGTTTMTGIANCLRLHIYSEPSTDSDIVCKVRYLTELDVDFDNSTEEYYKVCTAIGAEGFCQKELVTIQE